MFTAWLSEAVHFINPELAFLLRDKPPTKAPTSVVAAPFGKGTDQKVAGVKFSGDVFICSLTIRTPFGDYCCFFLDVLKANPRILVRFVIEKNLQAMFMFLCFFLYLRERCWLTICCV